MLNNNLQMLEGLKQHGELKNGIIYALYTNKEVVFKSYDLLDEIKKEIDFDSLLELHLFNENKEYRYIKAIDLEMVIGDDIEKDDKYDKYEEKIYVDDSFSVKSKITVINVINYIKYTDDDLLTIVNYRLQKAGE